MLLVLGVPLGLSYGELFFDESLADPELLDQMTDRQFLLDLIMHLGQESVSRPTNPNPTSSW